MDPIEFDSTLGGDEHLPYSANILKFAASRSVEIAAMTESVVRPSKTKLIFQSLPVHMRRRVMSHNCKRLPRKLRQGHLEQLNKSGLPPKQKRPSRKYRRRPTNLLEEYNRRKKRHTWLETHIWHAKRFHMIDCWGHRLPYRPCDKAFRACYRATSAHCLLQDISYYTPLRIRGSFEDIKHIFDPLTNRQCGFGICAQAFLNGNREGILLLYKPDSYPFGFIGKVQFIWVPSMDKNKDLWLFIHPSQLGIVESILTIMIKRASCESSTLQHQPKRKKIDNNHSERIEIKSMAGTLNRLRLTGPKSHAVLVKSLKCVKEYDNIRSKFWMTNYSDNDSQLYLKEKYEYWNNLAAITSPSQLPPRIVLGLIVKDPRLSRPKVRTKAQVMCNKNTNISCLLSVPPFSPISPLWCDTVREKINIQKVSNPQFVEHITKTQLIPGELNEDDPALQSIPIVLIQRPGSQDPEFKKIGYGCGWDLIIPGGYGLPFWLTLIMFGARSGGLRETESMSLEMGECYLMPDSDAGRAEEQRIGTKLKEQYFKRPPSKRVNYITYGISSPFLSPWKILLKDWCDREIDDFFVLRDKYHLNAIEEIKKEGMKTESVNVKKKLEILEKADQCLVAVYVQMSGKGSLGSHALICMPQAEDITSIKALCEPKHDDINYKIRKLKRLEHRHTLKLSRKTRLRLKKTKQEITKNRSEPTNEPTEYVKQMRELWLPTEVSTVRCCGVRETMGYISKGAFSFSEAKSCGVGYVAYNALIELFQKGFNHVLVRNTTTLKYRLAKIQLIKNL